jgi:mono/diheme cytochrome c family protein
MRSTPPLFAYLCLLLAPLAAPAAGPPQRARPRVGADFFEMQVRPLLVEQCQQCHGPRKRQGGLRVDSRAALLRGGDSGPAIVPGQPQKSRLIQAVHYRDDLRMPPKGKLSDKQVAVLATWVQMGAPWPEPPVAVRAALPSNQPFQLTARDRAFWSFQPVRQPALTAVKDAGWARTAVDRFILAGLEARGLKPAPQADPRTLLRRVTFDLIGLPPTPEEVDTFLADRRPGAYERVVERLLANPHHGERWARHWMDVARYGEDQAHTFQARKYPQGFRYRDWLVRAFNDDLPYDRFILEQLAADLLDGPDRTQRLAALGFFALGPVYYGDPRKLDQIDDRIDTLTRGLLGLTVACARCHDHKYDPIPTRDYYALAGVVAGTDYVEVDAITGAALPPAPRGKAAQKKKPAAPRGPFIHALRDLQPVTMRVHIRGNPGTLGEEAPRRFLTILGGSDDRLFTQGSGRLELARAIASPDNPLTARVMVNRLWQHHFGKGLVRTPSNFGALGERPTHPELLDYLTHRFISSGWSIKTLHREIVLSAAYRQSSRFDPPHNEIDPGNRLLWRYNRRRLEVEAWRDAMLAVAGTLDRSLGGPSADLASPANRRRTLYGAVSRHELNPLLRLFDFPDPNLTSAERPVTTVPLQQLFVLNSEFMAQNARALAARLQSAAADDAGRIARAFQLLYGRPATARESALGLAFLSGQDPPGSAPSLGRWERYTQALLATNEFLYID